MPQLVDHVGKGNSPARAVGDIHPIKTRARSVHLEPDRPGLKLAGRDRGPPDENAAVVRHSAVGSVRAVRVVDEPSPHLHLSTRWEPVRPYPKSPCRATGARLQGDLAHDNVEVVEPQVELPGEAG